MRKASEYLAEANSTAEAKTLLETLVKRLDEGGRDSITTDELRHMARKAREMNEVARSMYELARLSEAEDDRGELVETRVTYRYRPRRSGIFGWGF